MVQIDDIERFLNETLKNLERNPKVDLEKLEEYVLKLNELLEKYYSENFFEITKYTIYAKMFNDIQSMVNSLLEIIKYSKISGSIPNNLIHRIIYIMKHIKFKLSEMKGLSSMLNVI